jgi:hypothetical protein
MADSARKNGKINFAIRLVPETAERARIDAERLGMTISDYVDMLITRRGVAGYDYFAQQASIQSFVSAAMSIYVARKALTKDEFAAAQKFAYQAATTLFGKPSERPPQIGEDPDELDPRLTALFEAYGAG